MKKQKNRRQLSMLVGIGASAGGLEACKALLEGLSATPGYGMVLVVHLDPDHDSLMAELLNKNSGLPVVQAKENSRVEANHVYVVPPGVRLSLQNGVIHLTPLEPEQRRKPIDLFLISLAADQRHRAVGIILSGSGSDGTLGLCAIKEHGGLTLVQDPKTAAYDGMPRSALANAPVDSCLSPQEMPDFLNAYAARMETFGSRPPQRNLEKFRLQICQLLKRELHHDFSKYKKSAMLRRIHRRMLIVGLDSLESYVQFLNENSGEAQSLMRELLISVTRFFRDPEAFSALLPVLRSLIEHKGTEKIRIWVPACASGEEAYSLAMLLVEEFERAGKPVSAQIFATDIDHEALKRARSGRYPEGIAGDLTSERIRRFFLYRGDRYEVVKSLRAMCLFSLHNVTSDPPFSHIDVISCRNLLIYLDPELQDRVLSVFHYALDPEGVLFLGTAEALGDNGKLFRAVNKSQRIFASQQCVKRPHTFAFSPAAYPPPPPIEPHNGLAGRGLDSASHLSRYVLPWLDITVLVLDDQDRIKDSCGHPDRYLRIRPGPMDDFLFSLVRREWLSIVRIALHQSRREHKEIVVIDKVHSVEGKVRRLEIRICPYQLVGGGPTEGWLLIFQELDSPDVSPSPDTVALQATSSGSIIINQLEAELETTRHRLRATTEELEAYNEELRSTNEELLSMNEELQSSNEELESSREEIQSVNQELHAVNSELHTSITERDLAHSDLLHLFSSNPNPAIFLDRDLKIRQFTPSSVEVFHLLPSDKGRPLTDIRTRLSEWDVLTHCHQVCQTLESYETLLIRRDFNDAARSYQVRILPYLNIDSLLDGVVLSFVDVTELQQTKEQTERREHQLSAVAALGSLISGEKSLDWLYRQAVAKICHVLSVEVACLLKYLPEQQTVQVICARGVQPTEYASILALPAVTETLHSGRTVSFADETLLKKDQRRHRDLSSDIHSGITTRVPEDQDFPCLVGAFTQESRHFTFDEVDFIESIASLLGTALARNQEHFLNTLNRVISAILASSGDFMKAAPKMLASLKKELDISVCELWLCEPGNQETCRPSLTLLNAEGTVHPGYPEMTDSLILPNGKGLISNVWETRSPIWVSQYAIGEVFEAAKKETMSCFAFPLLSGDERLGVIACFFPRHLLCSGRIIAALTVAGRSLGELIRRNRAETRLRESEKSLYHALKAVPFPLCIVEEGGTFLLLSDIIQEVTGFLSSDISDVLSWAEKVFHSQTDPAMILNNLDSVMSDVQVRRQGVFEVWSATGKRALWDFTTAPLNPSSRGLRTLLVVAHDVSEQERERQALEDVSRQKDGFLALLGHELRNPLAAIRNGVQLVGMADKQIYRDEALAMVDRQSTQMALLIDGLLDINRIVLGKVSLHPLPLNLTCLVRSTLDDRRALAKDKGLTLLFEPCAEPAWVLGDQVRLSQVIDNLIGNSLKFTEPPGSITVSLINEPPRVLLSVKDTGLGMTPELAEVAFEPFRQGEQATTRSHGGLGLGLALVKHIVELHGGTVEIFSEGLNLGCEFSISLVCCDIPKEDPVEAIVLDMPRLPWDILYIEDEPDLALSLGRLLEMDGHQVRHAPNANTAIELVGIRAPEIVLCDIGLGGGLDGFALLKQFQETPSMSGVPVIAVTGFGLKVDKERSEAAGFSAHLTKPFELEDVRQLLLKLTLSRKHRLPRPNFCRILVVDDNSLVAQSTAKMLEKAGFEARFACTVEDAICCSKEHPPHLALLDLGLPGKSGIELKEELMGLSGGKECLYVALTGSGEPEDQRRTKDAGFVAHLTKPVAFDHLLEEIERIALAAEGSSIDLDLCSK